MRTRHRTRCPAGFTLIEMVTAAGVVGVLMIGMSTALVLATRTIPSTSSAASSAGEAARALEWLNADVAQAITVPIRTATSIQMTVPDRNSDGTVETIGYSWSGVANAPLVRTVNGSSATLLSQVAELSFAYDTRQSTLPTTYTETAEQLLSSYNPLLNLGNYAVTKNEWIAQSVRPSLPADTARWRVSKIRYKAREHGADGGIFFVQLRNADGSNRPTGVIEQVRVLETMLDASYAWYTASFSGNHAIPPGSTVCIVFAWQRDGDACDVQYQLTAALGGDGTMFSSADAGATWSSGLAQDIAYEVYGHISRSNAPAYTYNLTSVRTALRVSGTTAPRLTTAARLFNQPEVPTP